ncbi:hypothetical protein [Streptomyces sp. NPDC048295]|uniref:hypothetical protein n=1 Tax=Streptomyces sp. NPDC048295 TaxID=3154617 RepID=UPI00341B7380
MPMAEYLGRRRDDGLPADPWVRVHVRAGGTIERIAPASMAVSGSSARWRQWTGLPFDRDGAVEVTGAPTPVHRARPRRPCRTRRLDPARHRAASRLRTQLG